MPQDRHIALTFLCLLNLGTQRTKLHVDQFIVLFSPAFQFIFPKINNQKQKIGQAQGKAHEFGYNLAAGIQQG